MFLESEITIRWMTNTVESLNVFQSYVYRADLERFCASEKSSAW